MIDLKYSLVIEATGDPSFFGFFSPELTGFTGTGNSNEDCLYKARRGSEEHTALLREQGCSCRIPRSCRGNPWEFALCEPLRPLRLSFSRKNDHRGGRRGSQRRFPDTLLTRER